MAVPRCAWGRSRRTPVPTPHSEGQPPRLATPAVGPLRHLARPGVSLYRTALHFKIPGACRPGLAGLCPLTGDEHGCSQTKNLTDEARPTPLRRCPESTDLH